MRVRAMIIYGFALALVVLLAGRMQATDASETDGGLVAVTTDETLDQALTAAKEDGKPVLAIFSAPSWCHWCQELDQETLADAKVQEELKRFHVVFVDFDTEKDLVKEHDVMGVPTLIFFNSLGERVQVNPGFVGPGDFIEQIHQAFPPDGSQNHAAREEGEAVASGSGSMGAEAPLGIDTAAPIDPAKDLNSIPRILDSVGRHDFEKNNTPPGTSRGVGDLNDDAWRVRILAIRDLVRLGPAVEPSLRIALHDMNRHVRHISATVLGILGIEDAAEDLIEVLTDDPDPIVRGQAAEALGQIGHEKAVPALESAAAEDESVHVRHRAELAIGRLEEGAKADPELITTWANLDEKTFRQVAVGEPAPPLELKDTGGTTWRLSDFRGKKTVVLIWVFADWCPVCQREFHELIDMEEQFKKADVQVLTIECHDPYRSKMMVGGRDLWWPHLVDIAGRTGAVYGVDPMEFVVHDEWINRPSTIIVDPQGILRFAYYGTYWGDRPTIEQTLKMIETGDYAFRHPERREE